MWSARMVSTLRTAVGRSAAVHCNPQPLPTKTCANRRSSEAARRNASHRIASHHRSLPLHVASFRTLRAAHQSFSSASRRDALSTPPANGVKLQPCRADYVAAKAAASLKPKRARAHSLCFRE